MTCDCHICTDVKEFMELVRSFEKRHWVSLLSAKAEAAFRNDNIAPWIPMEVMQEAYDKFEAFFKEKGAKNGPTGTG